MSDGLVGQPVYRLISSRFPTIKIYEELLDPDELELAYELESLTNDRLREMAGDITHLPPEERMVGPGGGVIMAAFTHVGAESRFSAGAYGVYYAGLDIQTAIEESKWGQVRFLSATGEAPFEVTMRSYVCEVALPLLDIRGPQYQCHHVPHDWKTPQGFGRKARARGENGLWYRSVRYPMGECIAAFRTLALQPPATQAMYYRYVWDGTQITDVFEVREVS